MIGISHLLSPILNISKVSDSANPELRVGFTQARHWIGESELCKGEISEFVSGKGMIVKTWVEMELGDEAQPWKQSLSLTKRQTWFSGLTTMLSALIVKDLQWRQTRH